MDKIVISTVQDLEALFDKRLEIAFQRFAAQQPTKRDEPLGQAGEAYVNKRQAARLLSCSPSTIDNHARAGHLTRHYIGKAVRFDRVQVLNLAKRHSSTKQHIQQ